MYVNFKKVRESENLHEFKKRSWIKKIQKFDKMFPNSENTIHKYGEGTRILKICHKFVNFSKTSKSSSILIFVEF